MEKPVAVIEITDSCVRLLIGNVVDKKPFVIYSTEKPIGGLVTRGEINNYANLSQVIASLTDIKSAEARLHITISEATVVLPPIGFQIYQSVKSTNVVSPTSIIEPIDIQNVISLVQKEIVPGGNDIIDIIPDSFTLEQGRSFVNPPTGEKSNSLTVRAKVHTMPNRIFSTYREVIENGRIRAKRCLIAPYASCDYIASIPNAPKNYLLIDMNKGFTSLSLANVHSPVISGHFLLGENDLVLRVSSAFNVDEIKAKELLDTYGFDERHLNFKPIIARSVLENGEEMEITCDDLNRVIKEFASEYFTQFDVAYENLLANFSDELRKLPIMVTGSLASLHGFEKILKEKFADSSDIQVVVPNVIGVRKPEWTNCVGALLVSSRYKGSLTDQRAKVSQVDRVDQSKKK